MTNSDALSHAIKYNELKNQFEIFCNKFATAFPSKNEYGLEVDGSNPVKRDLKILEHTGKIELGFAFNESTLLGLITFYRVDNKIETPLFKLYYDKLGNWKPDIKSTTYPYSFTDGLDYTNNLSAFILKGFFSNPKP